MRVNITIPEEDLKHLDELAARMGLTRSAMLREAIRRFPGPGPTSVEKKYSNEEILAGLKQLAAKAGDFDGAAFIRRFRDQGRE